MTAVPAPVPLFGDCPMPGCRNLVDDLLRPCPECAVIFAEYIQPSSREVTAEQVTAELAAGAAAVAAVFAERRYMIPLDAAPAPEPAAPELSRAVAQSLGLAYKPGQVCWCCEERRSCRLDPDQPDRWICKKCEEIT
jgi:hypothetical protein